MKPFTESLKYEFDLTPESICIDAGSHEGNWSHAIWEKYGCKIIALEPIPRYIHETFLRLENTGAIIIPLALGRHNTVSAFRVHGALTGEFADGQEQIVGVISAGNLLNHIKGQIAVLKLNIEGGEYDVLEHLLAQDMMGRIDNLIVQPHTCVPDFEARWKAIDEGLRRTHELTFFEPWCWSGYSLMK